MLKEYKICHNLINLIKLKDTQNVRVARCRHWDGVKKFRYFCLNEGQIIRMSTMPIVDARVEGGAWPIIANNNGTIRAIGPLDSRYVMFHVPSTLSHSHVLCCPTPFFSSLLLCHYSLAYHVPASCTPHST